MILRRVGKKEAYGRGGLRFSPIPAFFPIFGPNVASVAKRSVHAAINMGWDQSDADIIEWLAEF